MGALPRPDVPPGQHRDLVDALHALHHRAGWPSLRVMAEQVGCSHTTVSKVFSSEKVPTWGVLELVVEVLAGDREEFRARWLAVTDPRLATARGIVGRAAEVRQVAEHLAGGDPQGLVLTGEAGVGKSRLVEAAAAEVARGAAPVTVLTGWCRMVSRDAPLLPVVDWLRGAYQLDNGGGLVAALASCSPFVGDALGRLLPELSRSRSEHLSVTAGTGGGGDRNVLFAAVGQGLTALARTRPLALVLEDAHWADATTLELVEYLMVRGAAPRMLVTWRSEDPDVEPRTLEWLSAVRRLAPVQILELAALGPQDTAAQLRMLGVHDRESIDTIWGRSLGNPLFTEQLAAQLVAARGAPTPAAGAGSPLPAVLMDVLARALAPAGAHAAALAGVLAVADRALGYRTLAAATDLDDAALSTGTAELRQRDVVTQTRTGEVSLRHPLFVDAIRRGMTPVELTTTHRRLASALASDVRPVPAEIAEHWRGGDVPEKEWLWRVRAARDAQAQFAFREAATQWRRALDLWPATSAATPEGIGRLDAYRAAIEALTPVDIDAAARAATQALGAFPDIGGHAAAELYCTAAEPIGRSGDPEAGLALVDRAIGIYDAEEPSVGLVRALIMRLLMSWGLNRADEGEAACARGLEISAKLDDVALHREMLALQAEHDARAGRLELARERLRRAHELRILGPDPYIDVLSALFLTDMLLMSEADADTVVAAARQGFTAARDWGLDETHWASILRSNLAQALRRAGRVDEAFSVIEKLTDRPPTLDRALEHADRAVLDLLLGRDADATSRIAQVTAYYYIDPEAKVWVAAQAATIDMWCGRSERAFAEMIRCLEGAVADPSIPLAEAFALTARAAADLQPGRHGRSHSNRYGDMLDDLLRSCAADPFEPHPVIAARAAWAATWRAELRRLEQRPEVDSWLTAANLWDGLTHPFDSAYCRWRAAQAAMLEGRRTLAGTLLQHAGRQARGHLPLQATIATTAAGG